jgi:hypothetical protein
MGTSTSATSPRRPRARKRAARDPSPAMAIRTRSQRSDRMPGRADWRGGPSAASSA